MDWPGAQEMAKRFKKTLDPKLLSDDDKSPELQQAEQQVQAMGQELDNLHGVLKNIQNSIEAQDVEVKQFEAKIKAYDAETKRITAVQASMSPEQIQEIVMGTVHGMLHSGELVGEMPGREGPEMGNENAEVAPPMQEMPQ
jgi:chromosome segregation ATPase